VAVCDGHRFPSRPLTRTLGQSVEFVGGRDIVTHARRPDRHSARRDQGPVSRRDGSILLVVLQKLAVR
jgi:hypothetical protein